MPWRRPAPLACGLAAGCLVHPSWPEWTCGFTRPFGGRLGRRALGLGCLGRRRMSTHGLAHGLGRCCLLGPVLVRGRFLCHVVLTLPMGCKSATHTATSSVPPSWRKQTRPPTPPPSPSSLRPQSVQQVCCPDCYRYGLAAQKLHWDTDATPTCASRSHSAQMEYRPRLRLRVPDLFTPTPPQAP